MGRASMTKQNDIADDPAYVALLDHGFVGLVDRMGDDEAIVEAARVSYGKGTKTARANRGLIRFLMRHWHTSPFEMCEVKLHIKAPIFVLRQLVRHRTASLNEQSARYSEMTDEFYKPARSALAPQAVDNKQGRAGTLDDASAAGADWLLDAAHAHSRDLYQLLLGNKDKAAFHDGIMPYDPYDPCDDTQGLAPLLPPDFPGLAREIARGVLPLSSYSELYWKQDLHNLFHLLRLRRDAHAQYEIRVYADAIHALIQPLFPLACEAFEDYVRGGLMLSRMETELLETLLQDERNARDTLRALAADAGGAEALAPVLGLTDRELREFATRFGLADALTVPPAPPADARTAPRTGS